MSDSEPMATVAVAAFDVHELARGAKHTLALDIAPLPGGEGLRLPLLAAVGAEPGPTVVVLAGIHGDEYEGMLVIPQVFADLDPTALRGRVLMAPVCNVPAFVTAQRSSPIDGLSLARVFPGDSHGTITQRIAHWLGRKVIAEADLLIDLHSAGLAYHIPTLVGYYHADTEAGRASQRVARHFGVDVLWGHPDVAPGRTVSFATERGIPWVYTEAPGAGRARPEDVAAFARGVWNSLRVLGMVEGTVEPVAPAHHLLGSGDLDRSIAANAGGLFVPAVALLADVRAGDVLGEVRDPVGRALEIVRAPAPGVVISMRGLLRVHPGDGLFALTGRA